MDNYSLFGLFLSAFISSTLFPGGSEALLVYMSMEGGHPALLLLIVASSGNTLGGMTSWLIGFWIACKYPAKALVKPRQQKALMLIQRWGSPVLLLSWLPVMGDPLCVVAGWLRLHWLVSLVMILIGKAVRYAVLLYFI